jgi:WD40 repeat protein/class 3 adenylate cyclase
MTEDTQTRSRILSLVFTDLVDSTNLKTQLGDKAVADLIKRHSDHVDRLVAEQKGRVISWAGDGCYLTFESSSAAVLFCVDLLKAHRDDDVLPGVRMGIHTGEITETTDESDPAYPVQVNGLAVDLAARVSGLAGVNQILLTEAVFDNVRARLRTDDFNVEVEWRAHGDYELKGIESAVSIAEIGIPGFAPLEPPPDSAKAHRAVTPSEEGTLGWRPAVGHEVPLRPNWTILEKLGEGGFGEVWLTQHVRTGDKRVLKFCFEADRLRALKREILLFRVLRETLGDRNDIARILDWQFEESPYYLESEYTEGGSLKDWANAQGGIETLSLEDRLEFVAQTATALSAAHSVGVLHKDIKPANILINDRTKDDIPQICLTDFGVGLLTDKDLLKEQGITMADLTVTYAMEGDSGKTGGTHLYMAPELHEGSPPTVQSDIYSLGVMLYQMVVGDFSRSIAPGWERDVTDPLLLDDIFACVDGKPERRLKSAASLAERIHELPQRREAEGEKQRKEQRRALARRRMKMLRLATAASFLVIIAVGYVAYQESERAKSELNSRIEVEEVNSELNETIQAKDLAMSDLKTRTFELEQANYFLGITSSFNALRNGQPSFARGALRDLPESLRSWEWGHLVLEAFADEIRTRTTNEIQWTNSLSQAQNWGIGSPMKSMTLPGHTTAIESLEVISAGRLLSGGNDGQAILWDLETGEILKSFSENSEVEWNARMTKDMTIAITTRPWDRSLRTWSVATEGVTRVFEDAHDQVIEMARFSPDDSQFYTASADGTARVWDLTSGDILTRFEGHEGAVTDIRDIGNSKIVTASIDGTVRIWDKNTGTLESTTQGPVKMELTRVDLSRSGRYAVTLTSNGTSTVWDTSDGALLFEITDRSGTRNLGDFSPDETALVLPAANGGAIVYDVADGEILERVGEDEERVVSAFFAPDGKSIFTGSNTGSIKVWNPGEPTDRNLLKGHSDIIYHITFDKDGKRMITSGYDGQSIVWDLASRKVLARLAADGEESNSAYFSPSQDRILTRTWQGGFRYWDPVTYQPVDLGFAPPPASKPPMGGSRVEFTLVMSGLGRNPLANNGHFLSLVDGEFLVRHADTGDVVSSFKEQQKPTGLFNYSHDGKKVVTGSNGGEIWVWELDTGNPIAKLEGHKGAVSYTSFSPDDSRIVSGGLDFKARIWNAHTGDLLHTLEGHKSLVVMAVIDPTGQIVATGAADNKIMLWDIKSGERLHTLEGLPGSANIVEFSPTGDRLLGMTVDALAIWDIDGNNLLELPTRVPTKEDDEDDPFPLLAFATWSPDGQNVVASYRDGTVRIYPSFEWSELKKQGSTDSSLEEKLQIMFNTSTEDSSLQSDD